eukprot:962138-Prymnesium_polylepis.1
MHVEPRDSGLAARRQGRHEARRTTYAEREVHNRVDVRVFSEGSDRVLAGNHADNVRERHTAASHQLSRGTREQVAV